MSFVPPRPTPIYRIMHVQNLPGVIDAGCIKCENQRLMVGSDYRSIAHQNIQARRHQTVVACGSGGTIHDYVPWYFAPCSPMLYANHKGNVATNPDGQQAIIYLVSTLEAVVAAGLPFVFTDGHAIMFNSNFYADLGHLDKVDWPLMQSKYWHAIDTDPDRPRRRQAEFLVHQSFPWNLVEEIAVYDEGRHAEVRTCLQAAVHQPNVRLRRAWYF
jgi:hypothetical protein